MCVIFKVAKHDRRLRDFGEGLKWAPWQKHRTCLTAGQLTMALRCIICSVPQRPNPIFLRGHLPTPTLAPSRDFYRPALTAQRLLRTSCSSLDSSLYPRTQLPLRLRLQQQLQQARTTRSICSLLNFVTPKPGKAHSWNLAKSANSSMTSLWCFGTLSVCCSFRRVLTSPTPS